MHDKTSLENEQALLQLIAGGDENAFATLFHHYQQHLLRVVYQFVKSQALAEEIVQDIFLKIWTGREKLPEVQQLLHQAVNRLPEQQQSRRSSKKPPRQ